jgi:carbohydrate-selective porin OprB
MAEPAPDARTFPAPLCFRVIPTRQPCDFGTNKTKLMKLMKHLTTTSLLLCMSLHAISLMAEPAERWQDRERITGDLLGIRTASEQAGISPFASYTAIYAANPSGGLKRDDNYASDMYFGLGFDLGKMIGWPGTTIKISGIDRHGHSIADAVGSRFDPMQLYGGQTTFLYEFNLEKKFGDEFSVKLGRLGSLDDFALSPLFGYSVNNALNGSIRASLMDGVMTSYPYATWGARLKYRPSEHHEFQLGAYQLSNDLWNPAKHGTNFRISRHDGASVMLQYDLRTTINGRHRAHVFAGMNNVSHSMREFGTGNTAHYLLRLYAHGELEYANGLALFVAASHSPHDKLVPMQSQASVGANWKGLIPARPEDHTYLYVTYGRLSKKLPHAAGTPAPDAEMVFEAGHRIQLTPAIYVQPMVQYIRKPGGTRATSDALVVGVQASVAIF